MLKKTIIARKMKNKINIDKKILLLGASSDMGLALLDRLNLSKLRSLRYIKWLFEIIVYQLAILTIP